MKFSASSRLIHELIKIIRTIIELQNPTDNTVQISAKLWL